MYKKIDEYDNYFINKSGQIYTITKNGSKRYLKANINKRGYVRVGLTKKGKTKEHLVHRLVCQTFLSNPENKPYVNHKDGDKQNNDLSNLEWCTAKENSIHSIYVLGKVPEITCNKKCKTYNAGVFEKEFNSIEECVDYLNEVYGYSKYSLRKYFNCGYHSIIIE